MFKSKKKKIKEDVLFLEDDRPGVGVSARVK